MNTMYPLGTKTWCWRGKRIFLTLYEQIDDAIAVLNLDRLHEDGNREAAGVG